MPAAKIAITLERDLLTRLDRLVAQRKYPSRSRAIQQALIEQWNRSATSRLAIECDKLDPDEEKQLADEGLAEDARQWPAY